MPFKSAKQRRYLWKFHPEIAEEWEHKYGHKKKDLLNDGHHKKKKKKKH
jgi:hypothetical protein